MTLCAAVILAFAPIGPAAAGMADDTACAAAIDAAAARARLPPRLLSAIGMVESGRADPRTGRARPWPWTINIAGTGTFFDSKAAAIDAVRRAQAAHIASIDVGCLQINLLYHPDAFADLDAAFDPPTNAGYAAAFLQRLRGQTGAWPTAAAAYHSMTPVLGADYLRRITAFWPDSGVGIPAPGATDIDPFGVLTSSFRTHLLDAAAARASRDARLDQHGMAWPKEERMVFFEKQHQKTSIVPEARLRHDASRHVAPAVRPLPPRSA